MVRRYGALVAAASGLRVPVGAPLSRVPVKGAGCDSLSFKSASWGPLYTA